MLHQSLTELAQQASQSTSPAVARGVLAEAQDLLRNALDHRAPENELTTWFSSVVADTLTSPAGRALDPTLVPTGAVARGDATPATAVQWLSDDGSEVADLVISVGLDVGEIHPVASAPDALRIDAALDTPDAPSPSLLADALTHRPPALQLHQGLPDRATPVDITAHLLTPAVDVARWADPRQARTLDRLTGGVTNGSLTEDEASALTQAWETGIALQLRRWRDGVPGHEILVEDLPALDRSAYGAAARLVGGALRSLAARHGLSL